MYASPAGTNSPSTPATLSELREQLSELQDEVSRIVSDRTRRAAALAQDGVNATRQTIDDYPMTSIAIAFAGGALIGLLLVQSSRPQRSWSVHDLRNDLSGYADDLKRGIRSAASRTSLADNLERFAATISATDANVNFGSAFDRVLGWFSQAKDAAKGTMQKMTE